MYLKSTTHEFHLCVTFFVATTTWSGGTLDRRFDRDSFSRSGKQKKSVVRDCRKSLDRNYCCCSWCCCLRSSLPTCVLFFLWLVVSVETPKRAGRFAIETLSTPVHTPMDNLFYSSRRSVSSYKTYRVVVVVVIVARARTNLEDTHTRTRSFICLVAIVAQIPQTLEERIFFFSLSLSRKELLSQTRTSISRKKDNDDYEFYEHHHHIRVFLATRVFPEDHHERRTSEQ